MVRFIKLSSRILFVFAALWSVGAGLWIAFTPLTVQFATLSQSITGESTVEQGVHQVSWYSAQGLWGIIVLLIFAGLYISAAVFAWRLRKWRAGLLSILAIALTILAGFSVGPYYLPSALAVLLGTILLAFLPASPASYSAGSE